jgi:hypothetical protein
MRGAYWVLVGKPEGRNHFENRGLDGRVILKWLLKKWYLEAWTGLIWLKTDRWRHVVNVAMNLRVL